MSAGYMNAAGATYNFRAPESGTGIKEVQFPYFEKQAVELSSNKADVTVNHTETQLIVGSEALAAKATLTLTVNAPAGSKVYVAFENGGTAYGVDLKVGEQTVALAGAQNKVLFYALMWDGTSLFVI